MNALLLLAISFTVAIQPATHNAHVTMKCSGLTGEMQDFKMPVWNPGFYGILDFAKNVSNFHAVDAAGHTLAFEKVTKNTWRVVTAKASSVTVDYDVASQRNFPAANLVTDSRAYLAPPGLYLHITGHLANPATVTFRLPEGWKGVSTGLDAVAGKRNTFRAPDFDTLYDAPILAGNQELLQFEVNGVPHRVAIENVADSVDRARMIADLKRIVEAATELIGDIPYKHYTFLMMGQGNGGIEHLNSASVMFNGKSLETENGYRGWLSYVAHEYFHNFNVKRIRPIALGPFDYDRENVTNMLWVSEGLSVYYQDLLLVRAGILPAEDYLAKMSRTIAGVENASGHRYQSATESSYYTWAGSGIGGDRNTTISYYDKGPALGVLLDLAIRDSSGDRHSLDDVMRALYRKYYQQKKRGFTDAEFQQECEAAAGAPLAEVFEYASTTTDIDYPKYFALAGLDIDVTPSDGKAAYLGISTHLADGKLLVAAVSAGSPAAHAGLTPGEEILEVDGMKATSAKVLSDALLARKPGDKIKLRSTRDVEIDLAAIPQRTFKIRSAANVTPAQSAIFQHWLRDARPIARR